MSTQKGMITPIVIAVIVIGLLYYGYTYYYSQNKNSYTPTPSTETTNTTSVNTNSDAGIKDAGTVAAEKKIEASVVTLSDNGFSPASITVKEGGKVTFKNESASQMWVASGPHPTHTNYPEFDEKAAVSKGQSYEFTFTKAGTWKYHNHLNPAQFGTVIVQ